MKRYQPLFSRAILCLSALLTLTRPASGQHAGPLEDPKPAGLPMGLVARGEAAISALGEHLPEVAKAYGLSQNELSHRFRQDRHLAVDANLKLFFEDDFGDPPYPALGLAVAMTSGAAAAPYPLDRTFKLHSCPGAKRVIYLDFDGHVLSGTAWNASYNGGADIACPPWDIDGNPAVFGDVERTVIQGVWERVAEDYLPYDVDVTTEYPGEAAITRSSFADDAYGMRVLISPISSYIGNYGGVAYVGVFNAIGDYYRTALVFPEKLAHDSKYIAEAAAHENGHTLGLSHDGTIAGTEYYPGQGAGETGWAPIMGVGYYQNLVQWSRGEYAGANNSQDDLTVMLNYGLSYRADDHGNTDALATRLLPGTQLSAGGIIERSNDVDVFAFSAGAGVLNLNISPAAAGANLDILAELYNSSGALVAASNPPDQLAAGLALAVPAGTYYLRIRGVGKGDPLTTGYTAYGSLGRYTIVGTVASPTSQAPPVAQASANPPSGLAPLSVRLDGSPSYDPAGSIVTYRWDFGDGTTGLGATAQHTYQVAGTYNAVLTVINNQGLSDTDTVTIQVRAPNVPPNVPPTARIMAAPVSGTVPLIVNFDGSSSFDPDGSMASYQWNLGDGTTDSGAVIQHIYRNSGNFVATLTVTDNHGATGRAYVAIQVQPDSSPVLRVHSIGLSCRNVVGGKQATATVKITNPANEPVAGATVEGAWSGVTIGSDTGRTDANGCAVLTSKKFKKGGPVTFTVREATKTGYSYDPDLNLMTTVSITAASTP